MVRRTSSLCFLLLVELGSYLEPFIVEAVKQTGSTSKSEQDAINARLGWMVGLGIPKDGLGLNNSGMYVVCRCIKQFRLSILILLRM